MANSIAIVTDSTADLPPSRARELGVAVIPLTINFSDRQYLDGVNLSSEDFYPMLATSSILPTTSQPSPAEFKEIYRDLLKEFDSIISIHISAGLSGTLNSAMAARDALKGDIHIVDSKTISLGIGLLVEEAVDMVGKNMPAAEIVELLRTRRDSIEVLFTLDTLKYLHKGGRIGGVQALMGTMLNIKPVVRVVDGVYIPVGKARRQEQALNLIVNQFKTLAAGRTIKNMAVAHGAAAGAVEALTAKLVKTFDMEPELSVQVGPVIGVHTGPGTVGAAILLD